MLDGLRKSKFHTKCKSLIKMTKTRLNVLKKKKCSVVRFLKNDVADLLRNGLDENAYGRVEGLMVEQKMVDCYEFMENFCDCVSTNLGAMDKKRECPEECKEAVQSIIYAAARVSEFPEIRDLRYVFTERYGNHLEPYINKQFVEKLEPLSATKEMKLQVLRNIAAEFSIDWNSRLMDAKLRSSSLSRHKQHRHDSLNKSWRRKNGTESNSEDDMLSSHVGDSSDMASSSSVGSVSDEEFDVKKPLSYRSVPPPYVKPAAESNSEEPQNSKPRSVRRNAPNLKPPPDQENNAGSLDRPLKPPPGREKYLAKTLKEEEKAADSEEDEEEKMLDDLLIRYSKASNVPWKASKDANEPTSMRKTKSEIPEREFSEGKAKKSHTRTVSEQSQLSRHVHPNMPDFDDLQARIAALKGR